MDWLYESPVTIIFLGVVALGILGAVWLQTGKSALLGVIAAVVLLVIVGLVIERMVQTDREKLEAEIRQIAADVRSNDRSRLYQHIYSGATELRSKAENELPSYHFSECTITKIYRVEILPNTQPKQAEIEFMVRVSGSFNYQGQATGEGTYLRYVRLYFTQEKDGSWKVSDYAHDDPSAALINKPLGK